MIKIAIRRRINELFNDYERGERPALRRADALFPTDSVAWRVNGDIVTMMIGGRCCIRLSWPASGTIPTSAPICMDG